jgi:dTDP-4-dehydrorhamnose 3,5-epimerase
MKIDFTPIAGVFVLQAEPHEDSRGSLTRIFCEHELSIVLQARHIVQINHTITHMPGTVRGLHFQNAPHAEMKIIRCLKGKVWDIAVDLRKGSPTFRHWHAQELSAQNNKAFVVPEGCAHGFQTLESECELLYLHTAAYHMTAEGGVAYDDPAFGIPWPLPKSHLSDRDQSHSWLPADYEGITL